MNIFAVMNYVATVENGRVIHFEPSYSDIALQKLQSQFDKLPFKQDGVYDVIERKWILRKEHL
jgi:hypothetical protein